MFLVRFFGVMDVLIAILIIVAPFADLSFRLFIVGGLFLLLKWFMFKGNFLSAIDFIVGAYCLIAAFVPIVAISILAGAYLFLKGFYSIVSR